MTTHHYGDACDPPHEQQDPPQAQLGAPMGKDLTLLELITRLEICIREEEQAKRAYESAKHRLRACRDDIADHAEGRAR